MMYSDCDRVEGEKCGEEGVESCFFTEAKVKPEKIKKSNSTHTVNDDARDETSFFTSMDVMLQTELKNRSIFGKTFDKFCTWPYGKLRNLAKGEYDVLALKESVSQYGNKYTMLLYSKKVNISTLRHQFWTNTKIDHVLNSTLPYEKKRLLMKNKIICLDEGSVAILTITGINRMQGVPHPVVYCEFALSSQLLAKVASREPVQEMVNCIMETTEEQDVDKKMQATRGEVSVRLGMNAMKDWSHTVKYEDLPWYLKKDHKDDTNYYKVIETKCIQHKGKMRKVVLTSNGNIFRFRSAKLEKYVRPGFLLHW